MKVACSVDSYLCGFKEYSACIIHMTLTSHVIYAKRAADFCILGRALHVHWRPFTVAWCYKRFVSCQSHGSSLVLVL